MQRTGGPLYRPPAWAPCSPCRDLRRPIFHGSVMDLWAQAPRGSWGPGPTGSLEAWAFGVLYFLGSGPGRGQSPAEWRYFPSVRPSVRPFVHPSVCSSVCSSVRSSIRPPSAGPQTTPAGPHTPLAGPQTPPTGPQTTELGLRPFQLGLRPSDPPAGLQTPPACSQSSDLPLNLSDWSSDPLDRQLDPSH